MKTKFTMTLTLFMALIVQLTFAQQKTVSGTVSDENGLPLIGATVVISGTSSGTTTDFDGNYVLNVQSPDANLAVSYIGFETQIIAVKGESTVNIIMVEELESLEEVQVVAFSKQKKNRKDIFEK